MDAGEALGLSRSQYGALRRRGMPADPTAAVLWYLDHIDRRWETLETEIRRERRILQQIRRLLSSSRAQTPVPGHVCPAVEPSGLCTTADTSARTRRAHAN